MRIRIFTDGACRPNPGPGGWAAYILRGGRVQGLSGSNERTTNNRMEMTAVLEALRAVPRGEVTVVTDSLYVVRGMTKHLASWQTGGWETRAGLPVRNRDLWEAISEVSGDRVRWVHVHSHAGHAWNERADRQARRASIAS